MAMHRDAGGVKVIVKEEQSKASKRREQKRASRATDEFRDQIEALLEKADHYIAYSIKRDLKVMTDMPYYGRDIGKRMRREHDRKAIIKAYAELLLNEAHPEFSKQLFRALNRNQNQTLRKVAPRIGKAKDVWEHAIPSGYIVREIIKLIESRSLAGIDLLLGFYEKAGQRALTKEQNEKLKLYKDKMPDGWDWRTPNADWMARYKAVGLEI